MTSHLVRYCSARRGTNTWVPIGARWDFFRPVEWVFGFAAMVAQVFGGGRLLLCNVSDHFLQLVHVVPELLGGVVAGLRRPISYTQDVLRDFKSLSAHAVRASCGLLTPEMNE